MITVLNQSSTARDLEQARYDLTHGPLSRVLVDYLIHAPQWSCPGADGMVLGDVLEDYPDLAASRVVPNEVELYDRHPELGPQIAAFFFLVDSGRVDY